VYVLDGQHLSSVHLHHHKTYIGRCAFRVAICRLACLWCGPAEGFSWAGPMWQSGEAAKMHVYRCPLLLRWRRDKQFGVLVGQQYMSARIAKSFNVHGGSVVVAVQRIRQAP
jgi:hypothetical protein